ncbi:hypothetical protein [Mangrovihabitans endophyticus]|uniref:hypothetical protein n=1 Tax=Mangrovihabitans endophyticus TaxID=1751298 RepID=UPI00166E8F7F|nr:hypothetical protein [Mangrovihabitans endophyticus]
MAPYAFLILPMAAYYRNPRSEVVFLISLLAFLGAFSVELLFSILRSPLNGRCCATSNSRYPQIMKVVKIVAIVSVTADIISATFGGGTIATQVTGRLPTSPVVSLLTPLAGWKYVCFALLVSAWLGKRASSRQFYLWTALLLSGQIAVASITAITQPVLNFIGLVAVVGLLFGALQTRVVVVAAVAIAVAWPTIYALRNEVRENSGVSVDDDFSAVDRLRFDEQVSQVSVFAVPVEMPGSVGVDDILRYGLVPRVLDSARPALSSGNLINQYLGGTRTSSYNFLALGNVYFFHGSTGLLIFGAASSFLFVLLLRSRGGPGPYRIVVITVVIAMPLGWTSTYPDSLVGAIQTLVASAPVLLVLRRLGSSESSAGK